MLALGLLLLDKNFVIEFQIGFFMDPGSFLLYFVDIFVVDVFFPGNFEKVSLGFFQFISAQLWLWLRF